MMKNAQVFLNKENFDPNQIEDTYRFFKFRKQTSNIDFEFREFALKLLEIKDYKNSILFFLEIENLYIEDHLNLVRNFFNLGEIKNVDLQIEKLNKQLVYYNNITAFEKVIKEITNFYRPVSNLNDSYISLCISLGHYPVLNTYFSEKLESLIIENNLEKIEETYFKQVQFFTNQDSKIYLLKIKYMLACSNLDFLVRLKLTFEALILESEENITLIQLIFLNQNYLEIKNRIFDYLKYEKKANLKILSIQYPFLTKLDSLKIKRNVIEANTKDDIEKILNTNFFSIDKNYKNNNLPFSLQTREEIREVSLTSNVTTSNIFSLIEAAIFIKDEMSLNDIFYKGIELNLPQEHFDNLVFLYINGLSQLENYKKLISMYKTFSKKIKLSNLIHTQYLYADALLHLNHFKKAKQLFSEIQLENPDYRLVKLKIKICEEAQ